MFQPKLDYRAFGEIQIERASEKAKFVRDWNRATPRPKGRAEIGPEEMKRHLDAIEEECPPEYADEMTELRAQLESFYLSIGVDICE